MNQSDIRKIIKFAKSDEKNMVTFLRDMIAIPSPSCEEKKVVNRIAREMKRLQYDDVFVDKFGNVIGRIGCGKKKILFDSHIDTVGVTDPEIWTFHPFKGAVKNGIIYGRGASDNKGAMSPMVYAGSIIKKINPNPPFTLYVVGSVQEEDCDGLALGYAVTKTLRKIDCVVLGECTDLNINIGHRGRMEIVLRAKGKSAHASKPGRGINAVSKIAPIISKIEQLSKSLRKDKFLGKGSVAVTKVDCKTDSLNCIPYESSVYLDRRLTKGEDKKSAIDELKKITKGAGVKIEIPVYDKPSHTGMVIKQEKYFPTWLLERTNPLVQSAKKTYKLAFNKNPKISKWIFSTNGVSTMGKYRIPTIGFGPSSEKYAHTMNDQCRINELIISAIFYSVFPFVYAGEVY